MALKVIMLGDVVGKPGRRVVQRSLPALCAEFEADLVIANAENAAGGSGLTPQIFQKLIRYGIHGVTLGDHVFRQMDIAPTLQQAENLIRPANLSARAIGRGWMKLTCGDDKPVLYVITVLGRLLMPTMKADDPFAAVDQLLDEMSETENAPHAVLVEIHAEATGEKLALAHYLDGRVAAVVGTHTHVPTADAKILPGGTAYITDLGMCGPYDSVLGRRKDRVIEQMTTGMPARFDVAEGDERLCGVFLQMGDDGRATHIERIERAGDQVTEDTTETQGRRDGDAG
jgi:metallophosphoesterase (TIGR00282 family)